jgi:glycosyltransferase involved in cell wall biosynthesis
MSRIQYSIVIPLKNEHDNVLELIKELEVVMQKLQSPWELILINDGSTDSTGALLKELAAQKAYIRVLEFVKNYGQSSGFDAGFKSARGEFVITMDGDRQNDPADIPLLLAKIGESDLVCGYRMQRKDSLGKKIISYVSNSIRQSICKDGVRDTGCSLKVYRSSALKKIKMYQGMHRFLPALFCIEGFRVMEVPVSHRPRIKGKSNYTLLNRSFNTIADLLAVHWMRKRHLSYHIKDCCDR